MGCVDKKTYRQYKSPSWSKYDSPHQKMPVQWTGGWLEPCLQGQGVIVKNWHYISSQLIAYLHDWPYLDTSYDFCLQQWLTFDIAAACPKKSMDSSPSHTTSPSHTASSSHSASPSHKHLVTETQQRITQLERAIKDINGVKASLKHNAIEVSGHSWRTVEAIHAKE